MAKIEKADIFAGSVLRLIREANGESQEKLAPVLGVTFQQVQKYEKGTNRLTPAKIKRACDHYKCSPVIFFEGQLATDYLAGRQAVKQIEAITTIIKGK